MEGVVHRAVKRKFPAPDADGAGDAHSPLAQRGNEVATRLTIVIAIQGAAERIGQGARR